MYKNKLLALSKAFNCDVSEISVVEGPPLTYFNPPPRGAYVVYTKSEALDAAYANALEWIVYNIFPRLSSDEADCFDCNKYISKYMEKWNTYRQDMLSEDGKEIIVKIKNRSYYIYKI